MGEHGEEVEVCYPAIELFEGFEEFDGKEAKLSRSLLPKYLCGDGRSFIGDESGRRG